MATIAWRSGIYLNRCIRRPAHYSLLMATQFCTVSVSFTWRLCINTPFVCKYMSLCVPVSLFAHLCHVSDLIARPCICLHYTSPCLQWKVLILHCLPTGASSHTRTANNTQRRSYYSSREHFSMRQLVFLPNWLLSLLSSRRCSIGGGWPG